MKVKEQKKIKRIMKKYFPVIKGGYEALYPEQQDLIEQILARKEIFAILPTGKGKSVCFQVPALVWENAITIVIQPIVSLINDQISEINKHGEVATVFNSQKMNLKTPDGRRAYQEIVDGKYRMIYILPEMLDDINFRRLVCEIEHRIKMVVCDEAHCISTWGNSFRPAYLGIRRLLKIIKKRPIVAAFTATATNFIIRDVIDTIGLKIDENDVNNTDYRKDNLNISMQCLTSPKQRRNAVVKDVQNYLKQGKKGVIFCNTKYQIEEMHDYLISNVKGLSTEKVLSFYGKMSFDDKMEKLKLFKNEKGYVMLCTSAFGMGVNIPDIEYVIHYSIPPSITDYYQEIGRGARNRQCTCDCKLYYCKEDDRTISKMIQEESKDISNVQRARLAEECYLSMKELVLNHGNKESGQIMQEIDAYYKQELKTSQVEIVRKIRNPVYINKSIISECVIRGQFRNTDPGVLERKKYKKQKDSSSLNYVRFDIRVSNKTQALNPNTKWETLDYLDLLLADAVYSLWLNKMNITPRAVWMILSGDSKITIQKEKADLIVERLHKMSRTQIRIESDDLRYCSKPRDEIPCVFEGRFLPFDSEELENGRYVLESIPPYHHYAELHSDIQMIPGEWIDLSIEAEDKKNSFKMPATVENIILKFFLLERIKMLNRSAGMANRINYFDNKERFVLERRGIKMYPQKEERNQEWDKYSYKRKYEEICGTPGSPKEKAHKGKIEILLDQYVKKKVIRGYKSTAHKNEMIDSEKRNPIIKKYTQVIIYN